MLLKRFVMNSLVLVLLLSISGCATVLPSESVSSATTIPTIEPSKDDLIEPVGTKPPATTIPATVPPPTTLVATEPPHEHSYSETDTVSASCKNQGYTVYRCSCGDSYKDNYTEAKGHSWGSWVVANEATVSDEGEQIRRCDRCDATDTQPIKKIPIETAQADIAMAVVKYINQFRAEEGSTQLTYLPGMSQVAQYRSAQIVTNFAHDTADKREALAYYQYGEYKTPAGWDPSEYYYEAGTKEAIGQGGYQGTVDEIGYQIACGVRNSAGHWRYVSSSDYSFTGIGCTHASDTWYICIMVGPTNFG